MSPNETGKEKKIDNNKKLSEALQDIDRFFQGLRKRSIPVNQRSAILETMRLLPQKALDQNHLVSEETIQKCYDCSVYLSSNFGLESFAPCQKVIVGCLPYLDVVSTELAIKIVGQMSSCYDLQGRPLTADSIPAYRNIYLREHLRVWERVAAIPIDPTWHPDDPANITYMNMMPPSNKYMAGTPPERIKEPEIRKQFEAMLEKNRQKGERNLKQSYLRRIKEANLVETTSK